MKGITIGTKNMQILLYNTIYKLINIFKYNNYACYLVGGAVRDILLNIAPKEFDFATDAPTYKIKSMFKKTISLGENYGCIKVYFENQWFEITTFRVDYTYEDFRHPKSVKFITCPILDSFRRDFTINSIYTNGIETIDVFNGKKDLKNNLIRLIGNKNLKLQEDPIRILRTFKFKSKLNFKIEFLTLLAIKNNICLISKLTKYRIHEELKQIFENCYFYNSLLLFNKLNGFNYILKDSINLYLNNNLEKILNKFNLKIFCILYFHSNISKDNILNLLKDKFNFTKIEFKEIEILYKFLNTFNLNKKINVKVFIKNLIFNFDYNFAYSILNILIVYYNFSNSYIDTFIKIKWGYEPIKFSHLNIKLNKLNKKNTSIITLKKYIITLVHINPYLNKKRVLKHLLKSN